MVLGHATKVSKFDAQGMQMFQIGMVVAIELACQPRQADATLGFISAMATTILLPGLLDSTADP